MMVPRLPWARHRHMVAGDALLGTDALDRICQVGHTTTAQALDLGVDLAARATLAIQARLFIGGPVGAIYEDRIPGLLSNTLHLPRFDPRLRR